MLVMGTISDALDFGLGSLYTVGLCQLEKLDRKSRSLMFDVVMSVGQ